MYHCSLILNLISMKSVLLNILTILFFLSPTTSIKAQGKDKATWSKKFGYQKAFIENKGQFSIPNDFDNPSPVLFAVDQGGTKIFFTKKGITYTFLETTKKIKDARELERERREEIKHPEDHARHEKEEHQLKIKADQVTMLWQNANPNVDIESSEVCSDYHNYSFKQTNGEYKSISNIKGYKKIIYKNIYPNIDIEYEFHEKSGLKYSLTLHPGADPSLVKMVYNHHVSLNSLGEIHIDTKFGDIIDHAPLSFYQQNISSVISSNFIKNGKTISFQLNNYDNTQTVVIDPWTQTPTFTSNWDCVWECETDAAGNVYVIGGVTPMQLLKYNTAGVLQWTYNTPYDTTAWLGTLAVDNVGNSYVTQGSMAQIVKVSTAGSLVWNNSNPFPAMPLAEFWRLDFNCDQTRLIAGGTGGSSTPIPYIYEINVTSGNVINSMKITNSLLIPTQEVRSIATGKNGKYYFLTHDSIGYISQNFSVCSSSATTTRKISNTYALGYKCENFRYDNTGIMAIKASSSFLYTHRGDRLDKRDLTTNAIISSVAIPSGVFLSVSGNNSVQNSGIDIDNCGNVYIGSTNAVVKYDGNTLAQLAIYPTSYIVYDISINSNGDIIACGSTGNSSIPIRSGYVESISTGTCVPMTQICCDASICSPNSFCNSDLPFAFQPVTTGGTWSGSGITNTSSGIFDPSIAGIGTHNIKYTLPCGSDSIYVVVNACSTISVCINSGSLTAFGGNGNYLWTSATTSISCVGCPNGTCIPFICNGVVVPTWTASGTSVPTPASNVFPVFVKDVISNITYTFSTLASLSTCTATSIHEIDKNNNTVLIFPNPNNGEFSINYSFIQEGQDFILLDMLGKEVRQLKLENNKGQKNINVSDLSSGIYSYRIQNKNETLFIGKINIVK